MEVPFTIFNLFIFLFGLCVGSFLNVVIFRLEKEESFVTGRSHCPKCRHQLIWLDLIPVFSFLFLKGKCRYCSQKISWQYPAVEMATGLLFVLIFLATPYNLISILFLLYIVSFLIVIFIYDLKHYLIPDKILFPAIIISFLYQAIFHTSAMGNYLMASAIACGFLLAIFLVSKGQWMGFGDVKLAILLGFLIGFPNILLGLFLSFFFGAILGIILMSFKKCGLKSEIPFAPFLILGTLTAMFFGSEIIQWYFQFFTF
ncbi:MAG: prepilin peptidase [Candidatus Staskawiczbacteria bacterium]|nr:prepilin peptidase [Candidatus Staskawiczbacteria bacterium]